MSLSGLATSGLSRHMPTLKFVRKQNQKRQYLTFFLSDCILSELQRMNDLIFTVISQGISATEDSITLPDDPHIEKSLL